MFLQRFLRHTIVVRKGSNTISFYRGFFVFMHGYSGLQQNGNQVTSFSRGLYHLFVVYHVDNFSIFEIVFGVVQVIMITRGHDVGFSIHRNFIRNFSIFREAQLGGRIFWGVNLVTILGRSSQLVHGLFSHFPFTIKSPRRSI